MAAAAAAAVWGVVELGADAPAPSTPGSLAPPLAPPPEPALEIATPRLLRASRHVSRWAPVTRPVEARSGPTSGASVVGRLDTQTPEGTTNIVLVRGSSVDPEGGLWARVLLPVLPNNSTGWVPRAALGAYAFVRTRLIVDLSRYTATLLRDGRRVFAAPVGIGKPQWPTPRGEFYVRNKLTSFASPVYGPLAFGTSARSDVLTDWPAGGFVGIHGTNEPGILPGQVSHGCIRLRNEDILELARLMPVGTPLTIR